MQIQIKLYSILREKLPPGNKGKAQLELVDSATLTDLLEELEIDSKVVLSVNEQHETNLHRQLKEGDSVRIFSSISGGQKS